MITPPELDELERLARDASFIGAPCAHERIDEWLYEWDHMDAEDRAEMPQLDGVVMIQFLGSSPEPIATVEPGRKRDELARFVAAANPATLLKLITAARRAIELEEELQQVHDYCQARGFACKERPPQ